MTEVVDLSAKTFDRIMDAVRRVEGDAPRRRTASANGVDDGGGAIQEIGQYQGQAHMMVVNNADGWEFPFLHPVP